MRGIPNDRLECWIQYLPKLIAPMNNSLALFCSEEQSNKPVSVQNAGEYAGRAGELLLPIKDAACAARE